MAAPIPKLVNQRDLENFREEILEALSASFTHKSETIDDRLTVIERALAAVIEQQEQLIDMLLGEDEVEPQTADDVEALEQQEEEFNAFDAAEEEQDIDDEEAARREAEALRRAAEAANEDVVE